MSWDDTRRYAYRAIEVALSPRDLDLLVAIVELQQEKNYFDEKDVRAKLKTMGYLELFVGENKALENPTPCHVYITKHLKKFEREGILKSVEKKYTLVE